LRLAVIGGGAPEPSALHFPDAVDGAWGGRFLEAAMESSAFGGAWTDAILEL
jgi:hypothetical protein